MKTYSENSRKYLSYMLLVVSVQAAIIIYAALSGLASPGNVAPALQSLPVLILGVLFVFSEMKPLRNKHTAAIYNTSPTSCFERYLLLVLNTTVVFGIVYIGLYYLEGFISAELFGYGDFADSGWRHGTWSRSGPVQLLMLSVPFAIFAGATNMRNHLLAFILVFAIATLLLGCGIYLPWFIDSHIVGDNIDMHPYFNGITTTLKEWNTTIRYTTVPMFGKLFANRSGFGYEFYIWEALFLAAGYFKLKERQIK